MKTVWAAYKDELCIKAFPEFLPYYEALKYCNHISASLVLVKEYELQELLASHTQETFDNLWLGGRINNQSKEFKWEDGEPLSYTDWQEGYPRIIQRQTHVSSLDR